MFEYLEKIRQKPENVKKRIAFLSALAFAGLIFVVWLSVVYPTIKNPEANTKKNPNTPSPLTALSDNLSSGISSISEGMKEAKDTVESFAGFDWATFASTSGSFLATTSPVQAPESTE